MPIYKPINSISYDATVGNNHFRTIADGCAAFGLKPVKCGWSVKAGARFENASHPDPTLHRVTLWFPNTKNNYWNNTFQNNCIIEVPKDMAKNQKQVDKYLNKYKGELRITFLKDKKDYCFVGVFELDEGKTKKQKECIWERKLTAFSPDLHEIKEYIYKKQKI